MTQSTLVRLLQAMWSRMTDGAALIVKHPVWILLVGIATIVAGFVIFLPRSGPSGQSQPRESALLTPASPAAGPTSSGVSPTGAPNPESQQPAPAAVSCWTAEYAATACRGMHRFEMPSGGLTGCNQAGVVTYLGGQPGTDLGYPAAARLPTGVCAVDLRDSFRDTHALALQADQAAEWRRCQGRTSGGDARCSIPHTGEFVPLEDAAASPKRSNCEAAASSYIGRDFQDLSDALTVTPLETYSDDPAEARCVIRARNPARLLGDSLRSLGDGAVPWTE